MEYKVNKFSVSEGDVVIITVSKDSKRGSLKSIVEKLKPLYPNNRVIGVLRGIKLEALPETEMNKIGWYRK